MSTETPPADEAPADAAAEGAVDAESLADLRARIEELEAELAEVRTEAADGPKKLTIIATKGTLDMAYPPLILASTAAAFGWDVVVFHTFWGLDVLHEEKSRSLKLSSVGNPSLPVPNALGALPGMDRLTTRMLERRIDENGTASIGELIDTSLEMGVDLQACEMTTDLFDYDKDAFHDGVTTDVGAATALEHMAEADVQLLI